MQNAHYHNYDYYSTLTTRNASLVKSHGDSFAFSYRINSPKCCERHQHVGMFDKQDINAGREIRSTVELRRKKVSGKRVENWYVVNKTTKTKFRLIMRTKSGTFKQRPLPHPYEHIHLEIFHNSTKLSISSTSFDDTASYGFFPKNFYGKMLALI